MKIAIVNLIIKTLDNPLKYFQIIKINTPVISSDAEINIVELGKEMAKMGNQVKIFASDFYKPIHSIGNSYCGLSIEYLSTFLKGVFPPVYSPFTPELYSKLNDEYDIIQTGEFFNLGTVISFFASSKLKRPLVIWHELCVQPRFPGNFVYDLYKKTLGRIVTRGAFFVPRSYNAKKWLILSGVPDDKIGPVIHTGVNTEVFKKCQKNSYLKYKYEIPQDGHILLSVGRLHPYKGFEHLIRAMKLINKNLKNVYLIIKGNGPLFYYLQTLIKKLNLNNNVFIITDHISREELNDLYNLCVFSIMPSTKELFPNFSVIESLACGKPVIHSSFGGHLDLNGNGFCSYYVRYGDVVGLAERILHLIKSDYELAEMSRNSIELIKNEYSLRVVSKKFLDFYNIRLKSL